MNRVVHRLKNSAIAMSLAMGAVAVTGVAVVGTAIAANQPMVATTWVNLRSGPGTSYSVLAVVPQGGAVTSSGSTGSWSKVTYNGKSGYMATAYLQATAAASTGSSSFSGTSTGTSTSASGTARTTTDLNVRTGPGTNYTVVAVAASGTSVSTTGIRSGSWTQVLWQGTARWMWTDYLTTGPSASGSTTGSSASGSTTSATTTATTAGKVRTTANVNLRTDGYLTAPVFGVLSANSVVATTGKTTSAYTQVSYQGRLLWIATSYTQAVTASSPAYLSSTTSTSSTSTSGSAAGRAAAQYALSKVGGAYVWGGEGPSSFDCSGLVMLAYRQVGVSLPHSSRTQSTMGTPVSYANMQPGDLLFWYSPVSHVSMYVGGGMMVQALNPNVGIVYQSVSSFMSQPLTTIRRFS